jgi:nucleoside-diphosphate-sugar epimerase
MVFEPERKGEIKRNLSDVRKARKILGFGSPKLLEEGLQEVYAWFLKVDPETWKKVKILSGSE